MWEVSFNFNIKLQQSCHAHFEGFTHVKSVTVFTMTQINFILFLVNCPENRYEYWMFYEDNHVNMVQN